MSLQPVDHISELCRWITEREYRFEDVVNGIGRDQLPDTAHLAVDLV